MAKGLDKAIDKLFENYEKALSEAMEHASKIAKDDIEFKAKSCLYEYYDNYDPNWYNRTGRLESAFAPYKELSRSTGSITTSVGMGYSSSALEGIYYSNGVEAYQPFPGSKVLENYLAGVHPGTNGYPIWASKLVDTSVTDSESPDSKMEKYLNQYVKTFSNNVLKSFVQQL